MSWLAKLVCIISRQTLDQDISGLTFGHTVIMYRCYYLTLSIIVLCHYLPLIVLALCHHGQRAVTLRSWKNASS